MSNLCYPSKRANDLGYRMSWAALGLVDVAVVVAVVLEVVMVLVVVDKAYPSLLASVCDIRKDLTVLLWL